MDTIWFTDPPYGILSDYEGYIGNKNIKDVMFLDLILKTIN